MIDLNQLKDRIYIHTDRFKSKIDQFCIEIDIVESIKLLKSESTFIDDRIRTEISIRNRRFESRTLIALAYNLSLKPNIKLKN